MYASFDTRKLYFRSQFQLKLRPRGLDFAPYFATHDPPLRGDRSSSMLQDGDSSNSERIRSAYAVVKKHDGSMLSFRVS